jgi:hypothetical protein
MHQYRRLNNKRKINEDFNLTNSKYIIDKLKELLFKTIPEIKQASQTVINVVINLIKIFFKKGLNENKNINEGFLDSVKSSFNSISNFLGNIFKDDEQTENITVLDVSTEKDTSSSSQNQNKIDFIKDDKNTTFDDYSILLHLYEEVPDGKALLIKEIDIELINSICKLKETKLFAIKDEENYLCMPFQENDFKGFQAIKVSQYYKSFYEVSDEDYQGLYNVILQFYDFYKKNPKFSKNKTIKYKDTNIVFEYSADENITYGGYFAPSDKGIHIPFFKNINNFDINQNFITVIHEYIHMMDEKENIKKFTNWDISDFMNEIFDLYDHNKIVSLSDLEKDLKITNKSAFRYLISVLQKHKFIDYYQNDYTKIIILIDTKLGAPNVLSDVGKKIKHADINYFNDPIELNTNFNTQIMYIIRDIFDEFLSGIGEDKFITNFILNNQCDIKYKNFNINLNTWEKINEFIKNRDLVKADKEILNKTKNLKKDLNKLNFFKNLNIPFILNFFKKQKDEKIKNVLNYLLDDSGNGRLLFFINVQKDFDNNKFKNIADNLMTKSFFQPFLNDAINTFIEEKISKSYQREFLNKNKNMSKDYLENSIKKIKEDLKNNYDKKIRDRFPDLMAQRLKLEKEKFKIDVEISTSDIENYNKSQEKELQKNSLLRQYISLLIS